MENPEQEMEIWTNHYIYWERDMVRNPKERWALKSLDTLGSHIVSYKEAGRQRPQPNNLGDVSSSLFYWSIKSNRAQTKPLNSYFCYRRATSNFLKTEGKVPF